MRFAITILLLCFFAFAGTVMASERESVIQSCEKLFGPAVDEKENLFEVNRLYVLRIIFDINGRLTQIDVSPKYFLNENHPDWTQPHDRVFMSRVEFEKLLIQLETVRPLGRFLNSSQNGVITNMTERYWDQYEHGFMHWFEW